MPDPVKTTRELFSYKGATREEIHRLIDDVFNAGAKLTITIDHSGDKQTGNWVLNGKPEETSKLYGVLV